MEFTKTATDTKRNLAMNIKYGMLAHGYTQQDLADKIGVNRATISTWCSGKYMPQTEMMAKLAAALDTTPGALLSAPLPANVVRRQVMDEMDEWVTGTEREIEASTSGFGIQSTGGIKARRRKGGDANEESREPHGSVRIQRSLSLNKIAEILVIMDDASDEQIDKLLDYAKLLMGVE